MGAVCSGFGKLESHVTIHPVFTINNLEAAEPHMMKMVEGTKKEAGCLYYGWTICGNKLHCRETYVDGKAAVIHLQNAGPMVGEMLDSGACSLDYIYVMGDEDELEVVKPAADALGAKYWTVWDDFTNFAKTSGSNDAMADFCTIQPTFTILDLTAAEEYMTECVEATTKEQGCLYYGWTICDDKLYCREAYVDGAAVAVHLESAGPIVGRMIEAGMVKLDKIEIHGPSYELDACREIGDTLGCKYWETHSTFSNFSSTK
jgi:quinol monooxygenase YgiN